MKKSLLISSLLVLVTTLGCLSINASEGTRHLILVIGAAGEESYAEAFAEAEQKFLASGKSAGMQIRRIRSAEAGIPPRELFRQALTILAGASIREAWIILLGHGTFDGKIARFNLEGPDVSAEEVGEWLAPYQNPLVLINCAPSSAPFVKALSKPNRVVVTATRSGQEKNATLFGSHLATALTDSRSDRDKDGQVSLLEAFLSTAGRVDEEYKSSGQLATEHAMIDDNADATGTQATRFKGIRPSGQSEDQVVDGIRAHQLFFQPASGTDQVPEAVRKQQIELEARVEALRKRRSSYENEAEYLRALEDVLVPLARLSQSLPGAANPAPVKSNPPPSPSAQ